MGEVVPARTSPTLHPPSPPIVHQLSWLALRVNNVTKLTIQVLFLNKICDNPSITLFIYLYVIAHE